MAKEKEVKNPEYNATELAEDVAAETDQELEVVQMNQNTSFEILKRALVKHGRVEIRDFGTFRRVKHEAREFDGIDGKRYFMPEYFGTNFRQWGGANVEPLLIDDPAPAVVPEPPATML